MCEFEPADTGLSYLLRRVSKRDLVAGLSLNFCNLNVNYLAMIRELQLVILAIIYYFRLNFNFCKRFSCLFSREKEAAAALEIMRKQKSLRYYMMFRYASWKDVFLMGFGIICATIWAVAVPAIFYL